GIAVALAVLARAPGVGCFAAGLVVLYAYIGYGLAAAAGYGLAAAAGTLVVRPWRGTTNGRDAVAATIATLLAVHALSALVRLRRPELAWLIPGCFLSGLAGGWLAGWITDRVQALQNASTWK